jgi:DNA-binding LacI/PurR family transcriptional regulator
MPPVRHVAGPHPWNASRLRALGWERALRDAGAEVLPPLEGDWTARSGYAAGLQLADDPRTTAIFAANDQTALGVIYALAERGLDVPGDVSVVGWDDAPGSEFVRPSLTTVRGDNVDHGRQAVTELMRELNGQPSVPSTYVRHELIVRSSTAPPRPRTA